jgi:hypothetical protein
MHRAECVQRNHKRHRIAEGAIQTPSLFLKLSISFGNALDSKTAISAFAAGVIILKRSVGQDEVYVCVGVGQGVATPPCAATSVQFTL